MLANMRRIEDDLVREYRHSPLVTRQHALALALFDEIGAGEQARIAAADVDLRARARQRRHTGGEKNRAGWAKRARKVLRRNADLVNKASLSAAAAARIIANNWNIKGDGEACPNLRTLANWIRAARKVVGSLARGN